MVSLISLRRDPADSPSAAPDRQSSSGGTIDKDILLSHKQRGCIPWTTVWEWFRELGGSSWEKTESAQNNQSTEMVKLEEAPTKSPPVGPSPGFVPAPPGRGWIGHYVRDEKYSVHKNHI